MPSLTTNQKIAIAVTVPLAAVVIYLLMKWKQDDTEEEEDELLIQVENQGFTTSSDNILEVKVPQSLVGAVIGRRGCNVKAIEKESQVRINLKDDAEDSDGEDVSEDETESQSIGTRKKEKTRILLIRGNRERTKNAEVLIRKLIAEQPVTQETTMHIPQKVIGRIIGKGGKTIRQLCRISGARIKFDREDEVGDERTCKIIGTEEQIAYAKELLNEKITEDNAFSKREKLKTSEVTKQSVSFVTLPTDGDYFGVYVSATENPGRFWIQMVTKDSRQLDDLIEDMTVFYGDRDQGQCLSEPKVGDLCCCPFQHDQSWYRAKITNILPSHIQLYYLDFGDSGTVPVSNLKEMRNEYCQLPFQAIECQLANVNPKDGAWSKKSCELFEKLSCCAQWKVLMARVVSYDNNVAAIELFDTNGDQDVNIEEELVKEDFAFYINTDSTVRGEKLRESSRICDDSIGSKAGEESISFEEQEITAHETIGNFQFSDESSDMDESNSFEFAPMISPDTSAERDASPDIEPLGARAPVEEPTVSAVEHSVVSCADISQLPNLLNFETTVSNGPTTVPSEFPIDLEEKAQPAVEEPAIVHCRADENMSSPSGTFVTNEITIQRERSNSTEFQHVLDEQLTPTAETQHVSYSEMADIHSEITNGTTSNLVRGNEDDSTGFGVNLNDSNADGDSRDGDPANASSTDETTPQKAELDSRPDMASASIGPRQNSAFKGGKRVLAANFSQAPSGSSREESEDDEDDDSLYMSAREDTDSVGFVSATGSSVDLRASDSEGDVTPSGYLSDSDEDLSGDRTSEHNKTRLDSTLLAEKLENYTDQ